MLDSEIFRLLGHWVGIPFAVAEADSSLHLSSRRSDPGGHFLSHPQTLERMRDQWLPRLFDRRGWDEWLAEPEIGPRASGFAERVRDLLESPPTRTD